MIRKLATCLATGVAAFGLARLCLCLAGTESAARVVPVCRR